MSLKYEPASEPLHNFERVEYRRIEESFPSIEESFASIAVILPSTCTAA